MTTTIETPVSQINGNHEFVAEGVTFKPWLGRQRLAVIVTVPETGNWSVGDLVHVGDGRDMRKVTDRRTRLHGDWRDYALPVHEETLAKMFADEWLYGDPYDTSNGGFVVTKTPRPTYTPGDYVGRIYRVVNTSGYMRPVDTPDSGDIGWNYRYHLRVTESNMDAFRTALAEKMTQFWQSISMPTQTEPVNGLLTHGVVEWVDVPEEAQTVEEVLEGVRVTTTRTPVEARLRVHTYALQEFVEETAKDYARRNSRTTSLNDLLRGEDMTLPDGSTFNWKKDIRTISHDGLVYVSLESVEKAAEGGRNHFNWCEVAYDVVRACRNGMVTRPYRVQHTWETSDRTQPMTYIRTNLSVEAWSEPNAYRIAREQAEERLAQMGVDVSAGRLGEYDCIAQ